MVPKVKAVIAREKNAPAMLETILSDDFPCPPSRDFPMLVAHYKQGNLDLDAFVTERITIDQVEDAFARMPEGKALRSVVELPSGP